MNFSFEGNYKPRRNINLGGVKSVDDKRSLLAKAQAERRAREQDRLKLKSAQRLQAFYRGRKQASVIRQQLRLEFETLLTTTTTTKLAQHLDTEEQKSNIFTLTRQIVLFYQPGVDNKYLEEYINFMGSTPHLLGAMFDLKDEAQLDSWIWLTCLLIKRVLLKSTELLNAALYLHLLMGPSVYMREEYCRRIITFALYNTPLLSILKDNISTVNTMECILQKLVEFNPPYEYPPSLLVQKFHSNSTPRYLTRPALIRMLVVKVFTQPFLLDNLKSDFIKFLTTRLPLRDVLLTISNLYHENTEKLDDLAVAGLLMNITTLADVDSGKHLDGLLTHYAKAIQLLLTHLPVSHFVEETSTGNDGGVMITEDSDSSDDDDEEQQQQQREGEDVVMKEAEKPVNPAIRARLEQLYDSVRINNLLSRLMQLGTTDGKNNEVIQAITGLFNTLMLKLPAKKDIILNAFLYKSSNTKHLLKILWNTWSASKEAALFKNDKDIMKNLSEATISLTGGNSGAFESLSILHLLCEVYSRLLLTIGDDEFLEKNTAVHANPLDLRQVVELSTQLKNISFVMFWRANMMDLAQYIGLTGIQLSQLRSSVTHLLQHIHMRDSRRSFCPQDHWLIPDLDTDNFSSEAVAEEFNLESEQQQQQENNNVPLRPKRRMLSKGRLAVISPRLGLLNNIPFVVPFEQRVEIFRMFVQNDKKRNNIEEHYSRPKNAATVRRDHIFEDGFASLNGLDVELKNKVAISFVDQWGLEEAGIDGGGVFKEFLTCLSLEAFNTNYGLFVATPDQLLYPNPSSFATEPRQLEYFRFLGLVIGKAVYEGILLDVPFAEFFLKKCLGKVNYLDDLASLDTELYKGLLSLKNYDGNVEDLSLDFTSTHLENGKSVVVNLIPNGSNIPVTNQNRIQYIYLIANYRLNVQIAKQCRAFFRGLSTIVDIKWLRMFNQQELQILLGGASVPIDLADLRAHTVLGGYMEHDATVKNFWKALESFDNPLRMKFVKFVTSCSRPPLLGFKELVPKFSLRNAGVDDERFPTSSTCVNLLKLPNYSSYETLREKLLYAINADAGFDLS